MRSVSMVGSKAKARLPGWGQDGESIRQAGAASRAGRRQVARAAHLGGLEHQRAGDQQAALLGAAQHVCPRAVCAGRRRGCCRVGAGAGRCGRRLAGGGRGHQLGSEGAPVAVSRSHGQGVWDEAPAGGLVVTAAAAGTGTNGNAPPLPRGASRALHSERSQAVGFLGCCRAGKRSGELELPAGLPLVVQVQPGSRELFRARGHTCTNAAAVDLPWQAQRPTRRV